MFGSMIFEQNVPRLEALRETSLQLLPRFWAAFKERAPLCDGPRLLMKPRPLSTRH